MGKKKRSHHSKVDLRDRIVKLEKKLRKKKKRKHHKKRDYRSSSSSSSTSSSSSVYSEYNKEENVQKSVHKESEKENQGRDNHQVQEENYNRQMERDRDRRLKPRDRSRSRSRRAHSRKSTPSRSHEARSPSLSRSYTRSRSRTYTRSRSRSSTRSRTSSRSYSRSRSRSREKHRREKYLQEKQRSNNKASDTSATVSNLKPPTEESTGGGKSKNDKSEVATSTQKTVRTVGNDCGDQPEKNDMDLDDDTLLIIGKRMRTDKKLAPAMHKDIQVRWEEIYKDGLPKDIKIELLNKHPQPANVSFLDAPKLNAEIKASVHETVHSRDNRLVAKQEKVAACLSILGSILSQLLNKEEIKGMDLIEKISDSCRILVDLQRDETLTRRTLILNKIKASLKDTLKDTDVDVFLFEKQLDEKLKSAELLEKSAMKLKQPDKTNPKKPAKNSTGPPQQNNKKYAQSRQSQRKPWGGYYKQRRSPPRSPRRTQTSSNKQQKRRN